jgi:hypothetical protein
VGDEVGDQGVVGRFAVDLDALDEQAHDLAQELLDLAREAGDQPNGRTAGPIVPNVHGHPPQPQPNASNGIS